MTNPNPTFSSPLVRRYVVGTAALALAGGAVPLFRFARQARLVDLGWVVVATLAVAAVQSVLPVFRYRRSRTERITHDEILFPFLLFFLSPPTVILGCMLGTVIGDVITRRPLIKITYNAAQLTLASTLAIGAALTFGGPSASTRGVMALLVGSSVFAGSLLVVFSGLMAILEDQPLGTVLATNYRDDGSRIMVEVLLGVLGAVAVVSTPMLTPIVVAAFMVTSRAHRFWFNSYRDDRQLQDLLDVATGIQAATTPKSVEAALIDAVYTMTGATAHLAHPDSEPRGSEIRVPLVTETGSTPAIFVDRRPHLDSQESSIVKTLARIAGISLTTATLLEEREETSRRLADLVRSKEDFLLAVAHGIRTPLTAVSGFAELLAASDQGSLEAGEAVGHIIEQSLELTNLVDNLLVASRTGAVTVAPTTIDLSLEVERVVESLPTGSRPTLDISAHQCSARADPVRVRQITRNLILNALHHGGPTVTVTVGDCDKEAFVVVRDDGMGVDEADRDSIFLPFEHRHRIPGNPGSLGLGLSVSRMLARLMGGEVTYRREDDSTLFTLKLPTTATDEPPTGDRFDDLAGIIDPGFHHA